MAKGVPLIVSRRSILPEIVDDNQNGLVIDDTVENLSNAIIRYSTDKEMRNSFSALARLKIRQEFTLEQTVRLTERFYNQLFF
jgi:glycosyltransferase involved in cell wall biosynthesis